MANAYTSSYKCSKATIKQTKVLKKLNLNTNIVISKPDKGNGVVILNRSDYDKMILDILNDSSKFKKLPNDPTLLREGQLQRFLLTLKKKGFFNEDEYKRIYPVGSGLGKIYGQPKMHKLGDDEGVEQLTVRPIISSIGTYNFEIAKYLTGKLNPYIPKECTVQDSFTFVKLISEARTCNKLLVSYDVKSLFTNIPLKETIEIAVNLICTNEPDIKISKTELLKLFNFATSQSHFSFKGEIYDQVDGVAMGSPLGPVLANIFMGYYEKSWIESSVYKPSLYKRYVDDVFCLFENEEKSKQFLEHLNHQHPNIKFTIEKEQEGKLAFLDVYVDKTLQENATTSIFRKLTFTGLMLNFLSYCPMSYKLSLVGTLVHRIYNICNTWDMFHKNIEELKHILKRNMFPPKIIDREIKTYLDKQSSTETNSKEEKTFSYFKLPYLYEISERTKKQLHNISMKYCSDDIIKISFSTFKLGALFSTKDKVEDALKSHVVYRFTCNNPNCNIRYIGETTRHFTTRINEHLHTDKKSRVFQHLKGSQQCKLSCNDNCFIIIDNAKSQFQLKLKEAMHIKWEKPELNIQQKTVHVTISV